MAVAFGGVAILSIFGPINSKPMAKTPFVKSEITLIAYLPRILVIGLLCVWMYQYDRQIFFVYAFFLYLLISRILKFSLIPGSTFTGIRWIKNGEFEKALPCLDQDIDYYTRKAWIDRYRYVLMISASPHTYREITLGNKAYCLLRLGRVKESRELYETILSQYPENNNAEAQLAMINIVSESVIAGLTAKAAL